MDNLQIAVLPKMNIRPNKIVFFNQVIRYSLSDPFAKVVKQKPKEAIIQLGLNLENNVPIHHQESKKETKKQEASTKKKQVQPNKHNFELSQKASSKIKEKIMWLYSLAKNKTVINDDGITNFAFKMNFVTLTLPSSQKHTSAEITKKCLNQFITECNAKFDLKNYVWRLEFQRNGNAHYHIATDSFLPYSECISIWNRCINKLGYVDEYQRKFENMSFREYYKNSVESGTTNISIIRRRYKKGKAFLWANPNTVDVRSVQSAKNIAFYISKYITKKSENTLNKVVQEREDMNTNLRLWFCSRSLSKMKSIEYFIDNFNHLIEDFYKTIKNTAVYVYDYCKVIYFNSLKESNEHKKLCWLLFNNYAKSVGYSPSIK
jgi:hypothetical protein